MGIYVCVYVYLHAWCAYSFENITKNEGKMYFQTRENTFLDVESFYLLITYTIDILEYKKYLQRCHPLPCEKRYATQEMKRNKNIVQDYNYFNLKDHTTK